MNWLGLIAILTMTSQTADASPAPKRPNIVVILADDLGYGDPSCYNADRGKIKTPNIDRLAGQGMRFTDAHSANACCTPSRYAILTGRYPWRTRLQRGIVNLWDPPLIAANRLTIASFLKAHGYRTGCIGKWHLGWDWPISKDQMAAFKGLGGQTSKGPKVALEATEKQKAIWKDVFSQPIPGGPTTRGFDSYFGADVPNWPPYCFIEHDRTIGIPSETLPIAGFGKNLASLQGPAVADWKLDEILDKIGDRACDFIARTAKAKQPMFLYVPLTSPHTPIAPAAAFKGKSGIGTYGDFVVETDAVVGRILEAIDKAGIADDTLVIFTSDNGFADYVGVAAIQALGHFPSGWLRGYKMDAWEGGHRVPFIARWPGVIKAGTTCSQTACSIDLLATAADIVGAKLPVDAGEDSVSMMPLFRGGDRPIRDTLVHQSAQGVLALRQGKHVAIFGSASGEPKAVPTHLYDLDADLKQTTDLADRETELLAKMTATMQSIIDNGRSTPGDPQKNDVRVTLVKAAKK